MKSVRHLLFGVGIFASLGFGAASFFAKPAEAAASAVCPFYRFEDLCEQCCYSYLWTQYHFNPATGECRCS